MVKAELSNRQMIRGLTNDQEKTLKESLTYDNPKYKQAKRYSRYGRTSIPPYLTYYETGKDTKGHFIDIPIGVDTQTLLGIKIDSTDNREDTRLSNAPKFLLDLREDQKRASKAYLENIKRGKTTGIVQLPTGKGKTILALYIARKLCVKTLVLVHKDDLVVGWKSDIKLCFGDSTESGLIKAKSRKVGDFITIATVQTLSRMEKKEFKEYTSQFGLVIQDEVHHIGANIFNLIDSFNAKYKLGLSATPTRTDGLNQVFDIFFGGLIYKHKITKEDKDISQVKVIIKDSKARYTPFCEVKNGNLCDQYFNLFDYQKKDLPKHYQILEELDYKKRPTVPFLVNDGYVVTNRRYKIQVCKDIISEYRKGHSCLALFTQKEHIDLYFNYLKRFIPETKIMKYYGDSKEKSEVLMKKAESKEVLVTLGTLAKATEGTNVKSWEVLFFVSSINNEKNTEQAVGRIRRKKKGKINPVLVYDYEQKGSYGVRNHINTRMKVYNRLEFDIVGKKKNKSKGSIFSRGY